MTSKKSLGVEMKAIFILFGIRTTNVLQRFEKVLKLFLLFFPFHLWQVTALVG